jgi:hypothetical protein
MKRFLLVAVTLSICGCGHDYGLTPQVPGDPALVPTTNLPAEGDRIYYKAWAAPEPVVQSAKNDLRELLHQGIPVKVAWFPEHGSPCECVTCTSVLTIELLHPDDRLVDLGFVEESGWGAGANCGVDHMWRFVVVR